MQLRDEVYKILFKNSKVDGVRLIYEDEWPVGELAELVQQYCTDLIGEDDKLSYYNGTTKRNMAKFNTRRELLQEQRARVKADLG